jgi:hypothetical protein
VCSLHPTRQGVALLACAGFSKRLASLGKRAQAYEAKLKDKLDPSLRASVKGGSASMLARSESLKKASKAARSFVLTTYAGTAKLVLFTSPRVLMNMADELEYLKQRLESLLENQISAQNWVDTFRRAGSASSHSARPGPLRWATLSSTRSFPTLQFYSASA